MQTEALVSDIYADYLLIANTMLKTGTEKKTAKALSYSHWVLHEKIKGDWIYFFALEDRVKIGYTGSMTGRIQQFKLHTGGAGKFLRIVAGNETGERKIHQELKSEQIKGEWFWLNNKVTSYMEAL